MRYSFRNVFGFPVLTLCLVLSASLASAQSGGGGGREMGRHGRGSIYFEATFAPVMKADNSGSGSADGGRTSTVNLNSTNGMDLRGTLGMFLGEHLMIGFSYNQYSDSTKRDATSTTASSEQKTNKTEYGPTLGLVSGGFRLLGTYLLAGEKKYAYKSVDDANAVQNDQNYTDSKGAGVQVTLGYSWILSSWFELGPSLVYRDMSYANQTFVNAVTPSDNYTDAALASKAHETSLTPMISMILLF